MSYTITVKAEQDDIPVRGNAIASGDDAYDREVENEILERLDRGDEWAWAFVQVFATCPECGAKGSDSLGACCYESEKDFRTDGGYFDDMKANAEEECRAYCTCRKPVGVDAGASVQS